MFTVGHYHNKQINGVLEIGQKEIISCTNYLNRWWGVKLGKIQFLSYAIKLPVSINKNFIIPPLPPSQELIVLIK